MTDVVNKNHILLYSLVYINIDYSISGLPSGAYTYVWYNHAFLFCIMFNFEHPDGATDRLYGRYVYKLLNIIVYDLFNHISRRNT